MATIDEIKRKALELSEKTDSNSITPKEVGGIMHDLASLCENAIRNGGTLGIRKVYESVAAMEADSISPVDLWGNPIKKGNLVVIYDGTTTVTDNNKVYAFMNPGWELVTYLDAGYATRSEVKHLSDEVEKKADEKLTTAKLNELTNEVASKADAEETNEKLSELGSEVTEAVDKAIEKAEKVNSKIDGINNVIQKKDESDLYICDRNGNVIAKFDKEGIKSVGFYENGSRLKNGVEDIIELYNEELYIADAKGNVVLSVGKYGLKTIGGESSVGGIVDAYESEFYIADEKGNVILKVDKNGLSTVGLNDTQKNQWSGKVIATYGDSITALNGGDYYYPYNESAIKSKWSNKVAKYFDFAKIHNRGIGSTTFNYYSAAGGMVAWCKTDTGEYVNRKDGYNYDNYVGNVTIPSDCTAIRGCGSSWLRIKTMFPASIKDTIDVVLIQFHNDFHQDMDTECIWVEGSTYDAEWAISDYYSDYGGDYNIQTVKGGIASTIMKFQAWMPNALLVLMTPISGVYINENDDVKEIENVESAKMRKLAEVVKEISFKMSIPCIDVYGNDGINTLNHKLNNYITDGIHPYSDAGCKKVARAVISGLNAIIPNIV